MLSWNLDVVRRTAACALLLVLAIETMGCRCGRATPDDAGADARVATDAGDGDSGSEDSGNAVDGGLDAGADAGPVGANVRLANFVAGAPPYHICLHAPDDAAATLLTAEDVVPYRAITTYAPALALPRTAVVRAYERADLSVPASCPLPGAITPRPIIEQTIELDLVEGSYFTLAMLGAYVGTASATPRVRVLSDDPRTAPAPGQIRLRALNAIANLPADMSSIDVCFDADGEGAGAAVELFDDLVLDELTTHVDSGPLVEGVLTVHAHNEAGTPDCEQADMPAGTRWITVPIPFPVPSPGPGLPLGLVQTFEADGVYTLFLLGDTAFEASPTPCTTDSECVTGQPYATICHPFVSPRVCNNVVGPLAWPSSDDVGLD